MKLRSAVLFVAIVLLAASTGYAQQPGQIFGKVSDASGAVLPGVTVTCSGPRLLQPLVATSSADGAYLFPGLGVGLYRVKFELAGFKTLVRDGIRIEIGANVQINGALEISSVQETVTVTGETPVVDLRDTSKTTRFTQEALQGVPSARDPWVVIEQSAGVAMDRQNVGGSASGQQSNFVARGASMAQQKWNLDGVDITDLSATGGSPIYFDFDSFEEMQISAGGADVTMSAPGVAVNLVTKSGTDKFRGSGRFYITDQKFESNNLTDAIRQQGASSGNPIQNIKDYGFEVGGPIKKGRAWFWGGIGKQKVDVGINGFYKPDATCQAMKKDLAANPLSHTVDDVRGCLNTDETLLNNYNFKLGIELFKNNQFSWLYNGAEKIRNARGADDLHPIESTNRQMGVDNPALGSSLWKTGMPKTYKWSDRQIFSDRFMMEFQYAHVGNNFVMDFHDPSMTSIQPTYELYSPAGLYGRSYYANIYVRPTDSIDVTGNYFLPGFLGGDNQFKFGVKYRNDVAHSQTHYGGDAIARLAYGNAYQAQIRRDSYSEYQERNRNFYIQDSYSKKYLTVNLGIRFDYQTDESRPGTVAAVPFYNQATFAGTMTYCTNPTASGCLASTTYTGTGQPFNQLPSVTFNGAQALNTAGYGYKNWSPRIGLTYDLTGNGRNVAKFSYAHYVAQAGTGDLSSTYTMTGSNSYVTYPWVDLNHDGVIQANEIVMIPKPISSGGNYDYANPTAIATPTGKNDPNIKMEHTDEMIVSFDKQIGTDFGVGASFIYRTNADFRSTWTTDNTFAMSSWTSANYTGPSTYTPSCTVTGARCTPVPYYSATSYIPSYYIYTDLPAYNRKYKGVELTARKRMSHRWMMNASFSYNDAPTYYPAGSYQDPTNVQNLDGGQYAPLSSSSGLDNVYVNAKWIGRLSGAYTLPWWDIGLAGFLNTRSGFPYMAYVQTGDRGNGISSTSVYLDKIGDVRLPNFSTLDFRVDKPFTLFHRVRVMASLDIFNLFDSNTILSERRQQNASNANMISSILAPRVLRFGVRVTF